MPLGLDLRGGLYLLYQVDVASAISQLLDGYAQDMRRTLSQAKIPVHATWPSIAVDSERPNAVRIDSAAERGCRCGARARWRKRCRISRSRHDHASNGGPAVQAVLTPAQIRERQDYAIQQNITTLRNRVNELGVSEPIVQRQGLDRINVQLPGVQNSAEVKDILGKVATLEFRLEDTQNNAVRGRSSAAARRFGSKLYNDTGQAAGAAEARHHRHRRPAHRLRSSAATQDGPGVSVQARCARRRARCSRPRSANLNKRMGVVFIEKRRETVEVDGSKVTRDVTDEEVINLATIRGIFSNNFQITGMTSGRGARARAAAARRLAGDADLSRSKSAPSARASGRKTSRRACSALIIGMLGVFAVHGALLQRVRPGRRPRAARQRGAAHGAAVDDGRGAVACRASPASSSPSAWRWTRTC